MEAIEKISWSDITLVDEVGCGASGKIYRALLKEPDGTYYAAVKKTHTQLEKDEDGNLIKLGDLWHEAAMMARLCHPNIVAIYGIASSLGSGDDQPAIVMEYMTAHHLENVLHIDKMKFKFLSWRERVVIASQVAAGMEYMHSAGIIHFDLKGPNVLLDMYFQGGKYVMEAKICDFGFAREKQDDMNFMHGVGTPGWMAPEMVFDGIITEKVDVFSFGMIMHELLTGHMTRPIYFETDEEVDMILRGSERHPSVPECSYHLWTQLMRDCLACDASQRPSFAEIGTRLDDILAHLPDPKRLSFRTLVQTCERN